MTYIGHWLNQYETVASESFPLLIVLRHRVLSSPIMPLRRETQALSFIASAPLIQRREKHRSREEKAPSRSGFPPSMHVVLKTRYINPNIHVRRY